MSLLLVFLFFLGGAIALGALIGEAWAWALENLL